MATLIIIPTTQTPTQKAELDSSLAEKFGNEAYQLPKGEWLVSYDGTSKQLADELGISAGHKGSVLVLMFTGYWGRASKDMWEWISLKQK